MADAIGDRASAAEHHRTAFERLATWLEGMDAASRATAEAIPHHRAIIDSGVAHTPRRVELQVARADAPRGRALKPAETVSVEVDLQPFPATPADRRVQLLQVLEEIETREAAATVDDLTTIFDVSASTIRRDLRALRNDGHQARTRGSETG